MKVTSRTYKSNYKQSKGTRQILLVDVKKVEYKKRTGKFDIERNNEFFIIENVSVECDEDEKK